MKNEKQEVLDLIQRLPDNVTTADIMEELFFKQQIEKGLKDVVEGRVLTHQELKERIAKWRKVIWGRLKNISQGTQSSRQSTL